VSADARRRGELEHDIVAESAAPGDDRTLVLASGDTFAVFDRRGDFEPGPASRHGLYVDGTRFLARFGLRIAGRLPLLLGSGVRPGAEGFFVHETNPDVRAASGQPLERDVVHLVRRVTLDDASCLVELALRSYADRPLRVPLEVVLGADFADVFEVRGTRRPRRGEVLPPLVGPRHLELGYRGLDGVERRTRVALPVAPARAGADSARIDVPLEPGERVTLPLRIECELREGGRRRRQGFARGRSALRGGPARVETSRMAVDAWLERSRADLAMLTARTDHGPFPYAGVPWFFTPFGRDALVTAYELLWLEPGLARSVLSFLAAHQAVADDASRDAEVGKILHEMRAGEMAALREIPFDLYYGSADATPLFAWLAAAYHERTGDDAFLESLWPALELALAWIDGPGDRDGDGFVEYERRSGCGLAHQGWKDSRDAVMHADGTLAEGPVALCEVQAYVFGAKRGLARVARRLGRPKRAAALDEAASRLRDAFARAFWCDALGCFALALDGRKRPCRVRTSNAGQVLLTGLALPEHAEGVAAALLSEDLFSGWGVRTLAASSARYNPMSYHNGSVWPHDNALVAAGLAGYGHTRAAAALFSSLFDAWRALDDARLPELLCGFERTAGEAPTRYPVACSPQAWASGAVFLLLQSALGLRVDAVQSQVRLARPSLPAAIDRVTVRGLEVGSAAVDLRIERSGDGVDLHVSRCAPSIDVVLSS
jgi:glycogen debranching enzyme